ncbi:hypothetical protein [Mycobacterium sp.]|uniref:hypothetical protein n=1 Tax=Mycobacterium sp. TaxID=1785 RepID=UPI00333F25C6
MARTSDWCVSTPTPPAAPSTRHRTLLDPAGRATTCNPGRYFATAQAAKDWLARYPDGRCCPWPTPTRNCAPSATGSSTYPKHPAADSQVE